MRSYFPPLNLKFHTCAPLQTEMFYWSFVFSIFIINSMIEEFMCLHVFVFCIRCCNCLLLVNEACSKLHEFFFIQFFAVGQPQRLNNSLKWFSAELDTWELRLACNCKNNVGLRIISAANTHVPHYVFIRSGTLALAQREANWNSSGVTFKQSWFLITDRPSCRRVTLYTASSWHQTRSKMLYIDISFSVFSFN